LLIFCARTVGGKPENYFPVSRRSAAGRKFIFRSPDGRRQRRKLFSGLPTVGGSAEIYFPVSRRSVAVRKFIFRSPDGRRTPDFTMFPYIHDKTQIKL
jgi:hypothetical protein